MALPEGTIVGQLAAVDVAGTATLIDVYTVLAGKVADVNINIANRANTATKLRVAHVKNGTKNNIANEDYIIFDVDTANFTENVAPVKLSGILMEAGDTIVAYSSLSAVSITVNGIQEDV